MGNLVAQLFVGSDGKLHKKKKGVASKPSRTRRLIKTITVIKRFDPSFNAHGFAVQRVQLKPVNLSRRTWLNEMLRDLLVLKRDIIARAKAQGLKPVRLKAPEKKALRKELMHFRAEILGKVSGHVGVASKVDATGLKRARAQVQKQYPGLRKRNKARFDALVRAAYDVMIESGVVQGLDPALVGAPNLEIWQQALTRASRELGQDHPRVWMHARELYKQAGGGEVPGLNAQVGERNFQDPQWGALYDTQTTANDQMAKGIKEEQEHLQELITLVDGAVAAGYAACGKADKYSRGAFDKFALLEGARTIEGMAQYGTTLIPLGHIRKIPDYYDRLEKMEANAQQDWRALEDAKAKARAGSKPSFVDNLRQRAQEDLRPTTIKLSPGFRTIDIENSDVHALAAMADLDERAIRARVGESPDEPWYEDEWKG